MIPLMKNAFHRELETRRALAEFILEAPRLSMDTECFRFEEAFAAHEGRRDAILFNSGGSANLALMQALKNLGRLEDEDRVGFSALTWATNVMPILQLGMQPVPVDCDPQTLNCMSENLEHRLRTTKLKCFFLTNVLGYCGDLENIRRICEERDIILVEDNCESLGTELHTGRAGGFGVAATFSFYVAHHMSTIEGGMVCTDDEELAEMLRIVRANGWDRNLRASQQMKLRNEFRVKGEFEAKYTFYDLGYNLRPTEITGFLGNLQLQHLDDTVQKRAAIHERLDAAAQQNPDLIGLDRSHIRTLSSFAYPVICRSEAIRDRFVFQFAGAGVEIRPVIAGNMQRQPFYSRYVERLYDLPGAEFLHNNGVYFGVYPELTETDLNVLGGCLSSYSGSASRAA
ncbi:MAG: DegT/DnrJ/EryC1/StrS family aminotransferase [Planctomycetaceae bacterium]|nr:DegT/DnrJ/EryC1/StrS family aminotransferase [Planctomycetaceae bacterium]